MPETPAQWSTPSLLSTGLFVLLLIGVQLFLSRAAFRAGGTPWARRHAAIAIGVAIATALAGGFVLRPDFFPATAAFMASLTLLTLAVATRPSMTRLGQATPMAGWVLVHVFRLPLELLLHHWKGSAVPVQMTWSGQNFDVLTGALALLVGAALLRRPSRPLAIGFHALGLLLLANVVRIALTSVPSPFTRFEDPLLLPFHVPYGWIVPFAVMTALFMHIVALRTLLAAEP
ncbi:MAG: hypothetical protein AAF938_25320 [Myxococcota bacterium]